MPEVLTLEKLRAAVKILRSNTIPLHVVTTDKEARKLTKNDPSGHIWQKGDQYYYIPFLVKPRF
jgi:hypothetical protein